MQLIAYNVCECMHIDISNYPTFCWAYIKSKCVIESNFLSLDVCVCACAGKSVENLRLKCLGRREVFKTFTTLLSHFAKSEYVFFDEENF